MDSTEQLIKDVISRVNSTLKEYEGFWISAKRLPTLEPEVCETFEQYIEVRFNMECYKIPELQKILEETNGHLFTCTSLDNPDEAKRRFTLAHVKLLCIEDVEECDESLVQELEEIKEFLGGTNINFNNVKKKIKFTIE